MRVYRVHTTFLIRFPFLLFVWRQRKLRRRSFKFIPAADSHSGPPQAAPTAKWEPKERKKKMVAFSQLAWLRICRLGGSVWRVRIRREKKKTNDTHKRKLKETLCASHLLLFKKKYRYVDAAAASSFQSYVFDGQRYRPDWRSEDALHCINRKRKKISRYFNYFLENLGPLF